MERFYIGLNYKNKILNGNVLEVLRQLPSDIYDTIITSPPYWGQRFYPGANTVWDAGSPNCEHDWQSYIKASNCWGVPSPNISVKSEEYNTSWVPEHQQGYCKKCGAWWGQLGCEPTPQLFVDHLVEIFDELLRVLKPTGVCFLNLGDKYCGSLGGYGIKEVHSIGIQYNLKERRPSQFFKPPAATCLGKEPYLKMKQLLLIPHRVAIKMEDHGWLCRNNIIWFKANYMPHPVRDRFVNAHEDVFMFTKTGKYFFDLDKVRKPSIWAKKDKRAMFGRVPHMTGKLVDAKVHNAAVGYNPKGKNPGDVWKLKTSRFKGAHFATFPHELVEMALKCACPTEVCKECGKPKKQIYKMISRSWNEISQEERDFIKKRYGNVEDPKSPHHKVIKKMLRKMKNTGWHPNCKCNVEYEPGIVLDPFMGSGTTAIVAKSYGMNYTGIELSKKYVKIAEDRLKEML